MGRWLSIIIPLFFSLSSLQAQCTCTDCPVTLPPSGNANSTMTLSGATNPIMGQNGQYLRAVNLHIRHDAIDELDIVLIAPNGTGIQLSTFQGIQVGQNIVFDICFVACDETAQPDPGFPAIFESDAGYSQDGFYNGSYYPAIGCLEDLSGSVNGTWTLDITDNFIQDGGELLGWSLEFADNEGLPCTESCLPPLCSASESEIGQVTDSFCRGDQSLNFTINPNYIGPDPDSAVYDYQFVIAESETGVILDYTMTPNMVNYNAGTYEIHGLAYEIMDVAQIPRPDGQYTLSDLSTDISNNQFCAQLSNDHYTITVKGTPEIPVVDKAEKVCAGEETVYRIENYNSQINYSIEFIDGHAELISNNGAAITVEWLEGPGEALIWASNSCDSVFAYENIVVDPVPQIELLGDRYVCPNDTNIYSLNDISTPDLEYEFTASGGNILWSSNDTIAIQWEDSAAQSMLCVNFEGIDCPPPSICMEIEMETSSPSIQSLNSPNSLCQFETVSSYVQYDSSIATYKWSGEGIEFISGRGTDSVNYTVTTTDTAKICLEITSICGKISQICESVVATPTPTPKIEGPSSFCEKNIELSTSFDQENSLEWKQIDGPSEATIHDPDSAFTSVEVKNYGTYRFTVTEENELCSSSDTVVVEINAPPEITHLDYNCSMQEYHLSFEIKGGTPPFTVNGNQLSDRTFISNSYPSGDAYNIVVSDSNSCTDQINGLQTCPCVSDAGEMSADTLYVCAADQETALAKYNQNTVVGVRDTTVFVLHTSEDTFLGTILAMNNNGRFSYSNELTYGKPYFISRIVGARKNGSIDLQDSCLSVAKGQPVIFYDMPEASVQAESISCDNTFELNAQLPEALKSYKWIQKSGPAASDLQSPYSTTTKVNVTEKGKYTFAFQVENNACALSKEVNVNLTEPPSIENLKKECVDSLHYSIYFELEGDGAPFDINIAGDQHQNQFKSHNLRADTVYELIVKDSNSCETTLIIGDVDCDCEEIEIPAQLSFCDSEKEVNLNNHLDIPIKGSWSIENIYEYENAVEVDGSLLQLQNVNEGDYLLVYTFSQENQAQCGERIEIPLQIENQGFSGLQEEIPYFCQGNDLTVDLMSLLSNADKGGLWLHGNDTVSQLVEIDQLRPGIQEFEYLVTSESICEHTMTQARMEVNPKPDYVIQKEEIDCAGDQNGQIKVMVSDDDFGPYTYVLNGESHYKNTLKGLSPGHYELLVRNRNGCSSDLEKLSIVEPPPLELELGEDIMVERDEVFSINAKTNISKDNIEDFEWEYSGGTIDADGLRLSYSLTQSDLIKLSIRTSKGCIGSDQIRVIIDDGNEVFLPNVFYPLGSEPENRRFGIRESKDVKKVKEFQIFDRWGNRVFEHHNYVPGSQASFWDGTFDGHVAQMGVYIYTVTYISNSGEEKSEHGNVTLLY